MIDRPEARLSHHFSHFLDRVLVGDFWHTAVDHSVKMSNQSPQAKMNFENHRKWMGIKPHHLDMYIFQRDPGLFCQIELKYGSGKPTPGQIGTMEALTRRNIPNGWSNTLRGLFDLVKKFGFRLHENAENILIECEHRYAAAQDAIEIKKAEPAKPYKPSTRVQKPKPAASRVRAAEALRRSVPF